MWKEIGGIGRGCTVEDCCKFFFSLLLVDLRNRLEEGNERDSRVLMREKLESKVRINPGVK